MITNLLKKTTHQVKWFFSTIKEEAKQKNILTLILFLLVFAVTILLTGFDRKPYSYIYNTLAVILSLLSLVRSIKREKFKFDGVFVFFVFYIFVILINNIVNGVFPLTTLANAVLAFCIYELFASSSKNESFLYLIAMGVGITLFGLFVIAFYWQDLVSGDIESRLGTFFGNQDGVGLFASFACVFGLFFLSKSNLLGLIPILFGGIIIALVETRMALLFVLACFLYFVWFVTRRKPKYVFWLIMGLFVCAGIILLSMPIFSGIANRFHSFFIAIFTKNFSNDSSLTQRILLDIRSYAYGFTHPFYGTGYGNFGVFSPQQAHDIFGDAALYNGGIFAFFFVICLLSFSIKAFFDKSTFKFFICCLSLYVFVYLLSGPILSSRFVCFVLSSGLGLYGLSNPSKLGSYRLFSNPSYSNAKVDSYSIKI